MSVFKANSNACEESLIWLCNCNRRLWTRLKNRDKRNLWGFERRSLSIHGHTIERLRGRRESQHKTVFRRRHGKRQRGHCSSEHMAAALASPPCGSLQAQWIYSSLTHACSVVSWGTLLVRASVSHESPWLPVWELAQMTIFSSWCFCCHLPIPKPSSKLGCPY